MGQMKDTLNALDAAGKRSKVKVIVGGAPVTEEFARQIGADGYAADASRAVALAKSLISASNRSEEHTSELQSRLHLVCRLLLEKKKKKKKKKNQKQKQ